MNSTMRMSHNSFMDWVPRIGYFAKGFVYAVVGILAIMVAVGVGGQIANSQEALQSLQQLPAANVLLGFLAIGLLAYALWRLAEAFVDPENTKGEDKKGLAKRVGAFGSGVVHIALGIYAANLALGSGGGGGQSWSAQAMQTDGGPWIIGAIGVGVAIAALYQFVRAFRGDFLRELRTRDMSIQTQDYVRKLGRAGAVSRGVVFGLIAWFLIDAAASSSAAEAAQAGLGSALATIASQTYGTILLFVVAAGVLAYGVYAMFKGYYRQPVTA